MANQLTVQTQDAIRSLARQGWKIRRIAKELGVSRNTVRQYVRSTEETTQPKEVSGAGGGPIQIDPYFDHRDRQIDPLSTPGKTGRKSLCENYDALVRLKLESGLTAQRIFQDLKTEVAFDGSYESVKRYVSHLRDRQPELVCRVEVQPGEEM